MIIEFAKYTDKKIVTTYQTTTPESLENGDYAESGFLDEDGVSMIPDQFDDITIIEKSVEFLKDNYAYETSSSGFHIGIWYSATGEEDYSTGEITYYSYHLEGFTEDEEYEIWKLMTDYEEKQLKKATDKYNI